MRMPLPLMTRSWETFIRIESPSVLDQAPAGDPTYLALRGVEEEAPVLLRQLRQMAIHLQDLRRLGAIGWYCFLVHAYDIVPTTPDDRSHYIHLRFSVPETPHREEDVPAMLPPTWLMTRKKDLSQEIAGVDTKHLLGQSLGAWLHLGFQSEWLLTFLVDHPPDTEPLQLVRHVRQFLHFFANMAQMKVA